MYYAIYSVGTKQIVACGMNTRKKGDLKKCILRYLKPYLEPREIFYELKCNTLENFLAKYKCSVISNSKNFQLHQYSQKMSKIFN